MQINKVKASVVHVPPPAAPAPPVTAPALSLAMQASLPTTLVTAPVLPVSTQVTLSVAPITTPVAGMPSVHFVPVSGKIIFFHLNCPFL